MSITVGSTEPQTAKCGRGRPKGTKNGPDAGKSGNPVGRPRKDAYATPTVMTKKASGELLFEIYIRSVLIAENLTAQTTASVRPLVPVTTSTTATTAVPVSSAPIPDIQTDTTPRPAIASIDATSRPAIASIDARNNVYVRHVSSSSSPPAIVSTSGLDANVAVTMADLMMPMGDSTPMAVQDAPAEVRDDLALSAANKSVSVDEILFAGK